MFEQDLDSPRTATNSNEASDTAYIPRSRRVSETPKLLIDYVEGKNPAAAYADAVKEATFALQIVHKAARNLTQDHARFLAYQKVRGGTNTKNSLNFSRQGSLEMLYPVQVAELHESLAYLQEFDRAISGVPKLRYRLLLAQAKTFVHSNGLRKAFSMLVDTFGFMEGSARWHLIERITSELALQVAFATFLLLIGRYLTRHLIGEVGEVWVWTFTFLLWVLSVLETGDKYLAS